jgi:hypothetical protein
MKTPEQIAPTYFIEIAADETTREIGVPGHDVTVIKWATEFSRRLVAELVEQEPVALFNGYYGGRPTITPLTAYILPTGTALFAAPIPTPEDVRDAALYRNIKPIIDQFPEINPSNYDHDDVCRLNAWGIELVLADDAMTAAQEGK